MLERNILGRALKISRLDCVGQIMKASLNITTVLGRAELIVYFPQLV